MGDDDTPHLDDLPVLTDQPAREVPKPVPILWTRADRTRAADDGWRACCRLVDARDRYQCRCCGRRTVRTLTLCPERAEHHHVLRRGVVPALDCDLRNVLLVCKNCHGKLTRHELRITGTPEQTFELDGQRFLDAGCALAFVAT
jgi:hypothetical protein